MVFVRDRRAKQRENSVAGGLHHASTEAADNFHHDLECRIDQPASIFRIERLEQIHRILDIGE